MHNFNLFRITVAKDDDVETINIFSNNEEDKRNICSNDIVLDFGVNLNREEYSSYYKLYKVFWYDDGEGDDYYAYIPSFLNSSEEKDNPLHRFARDAEPGNHDELQYPELCMYISRLFRENGFTNSADELSSLFVVNRIKRCY